MLLKDRQHNLVVQGMIGQVAEGVEAVGDFVAVQEPTRVVVVLVEDLLGSFDLDGRNSTELLQKKLSQGFLKKDRAKKVALFSFF